MEKEFNRIDQVQQRIEITRIFHELYKLLNNNIMYEPSGKRKAMFTKCKEIAYRAESEIYITLKPEVQK